MQDKNRQFKTFNKAHIFITLCFKDLNQLFMFEKSKHSK